MTFIVTSGEQDLERPDLRHRGDQLSPGDRRRRRQVRLQERDPSEQRSESIKIQI